MIGIDKIITLLFLSIVIKSLEIFPGADVYVGEYTIDSTSIDYYVNIFEPAEDKVSLNASQQVKYGVEALVEKYNVTPLVMTYHYKNKHLRRDIGCSERHLKHVHGNFKIVLKYGDKAVSRRLIEMESGIGGNIISTFLANILHNKGKSGECIEEIHNIPMGKSWEKNGAIISIATCATKNEKYNIEAASEQIKQAAAWMDRTIDKYPYGRTYEMNFSNNGMWNLCLKLVRNDMFDKGSDTRTLVQDLESPKGHYDDERLDISPHDEL